MQLKAVFIERKIPPHKQVVSINYKLRFEAIELWISYKLTQTISLKA